MKAARQCFSELRPELEAAGIHIVDHADLDAGQRATLRRYYEDRVFPVLTPLAFDPGRPFPHISNMSHNLGVLLRDANGDERFARVKVPDSLPRLVPVVPPAKAEESEDGVEQQWFTWLEQVIAANLATLFPGMEVLKQLPVDLIVPAHGPAMDKRIIDANERYVAGVYEAVAAAKAAGVGRGDLDLPPGGFLADGVVVDDVYAAVHRENLLWAWDEV